MKGTASNEPVGLARGLTIGVCRSECESDNCAAEE
jgi:hypothetical protein